MCGIALTLAYRTAGSSAGGSAAAAASSLAGDVHAAAEQEVAAAVTELDTAAGAAAWARGHCSRSCCAKASRA